MRIKKHSSASRAQPASHAERVNAFRARTVVGQRVRGRVTRRESVGLFWIDVKGSELLARLPDDTEPGTESTFKVESLYPEVTLKMLPAGRNGRSQGPQAAIRRYWPLRQSLDTRNASLAGREALAGEPDLDRRRRIYLQGIHADTEALLEYLDLLGQLATINRKLRAEGATLAYLPWLLPGATGQELLVAAGPSNEEAAFTEAVFDFKLHPLGRGRAKLMLRPPRASMRLLLENQVAARVVSKPLARLAFNLTGLKVDVLGTAPLAPDTPGIVNLLLYPAPGGGPLAAGRI